MIQAIKVGSTRFYKVEGVEGLFPSVTSVLGSVLKTEALENWKRGLILSNLKERLAKSQATDRLKPFAEEFDRARKMAEKAPQEVLAISSEFGIRAHSVCETLAQGKQLSQKEMSPDMVPIISAFKKWQDQMKINIVSVETPIFSLTHRYAGCVDALATRTDEHGNTIRLVLDWKTSASVYPTYAMQIAAYARALEEREASPDFKIDEGWIVRFDKSQPIFEAHRITDIDAAFRGFRSALSLWRFLNSSSIYDSPIKTT